MTVTQIAASLGESQQNLNAALSKDDIRTGLLERISAVSGIPISEFYGEKTCAASTSGASSPIIAGNSNSGANSVHIHERRDFLEELRTQQQLTRQALDQNDRLLEIVATQQDMLRKK